MPEVRVEVIQKIVHIVLFLVCLGGIAITSRRITLCCKGEKGAKGGSQWKLQAGAWLGWALFFLLCDMLIDYAFS